MSQKLLVTSGNNPTPGNEGGDIINDNFTELYAADLENIKRDGSVNHTGTQNFQHIGFVEDDTYDIGADGTAPKRLFLSGSPTGGTTTPRVGIRGLHSYHSTGDIFVGEDNVFNGFYTQRTVVTNSSATDYSDDYTNLSQGDQFSPTVTINYECGTGVVGGNWPYSVVRDSSTEIGKYDSGNALGGGGLFIWARNTNNILEFTADETNKRWLLQGFSVGKVSFRWTDMALGGAVITEITPHTDDLTSLGTTTGGSGGATNYRWKNAIFTGDVTAATFTLTTQKNYTLNATAVLSRTLLASASATTLNNNNVLAAIITDLIAAGFYT